MTRVVRTNLATALWVIAISLMIVGTIQQEPPLRAWSLLCALAACVFTGQLIIEHERLRMQELLTIAKIELAAQAAEEAATNLDRIG